MDWTLSCRTGIPRNGDYRPKLDSMRLKLKNTKPKSGIIKFKAKNCTKLLTTWREVSMGGACPLAYPYKNRSRKTGKA